MKLLFEDTTSYSKDRYYLCETMEEYNQELKNQKEDAEDSVYNGRQVRPVFEGEITCNERTIVLDGFASRGGHKFVADGFTKIQQNGMYSNYSITDHFVKPNGIKRDELAETKEWWVA